MAQEADKQAARQRCSISASALSFVAPINFFSTTDVQLNFVQALSSSGVNTLYALGFADGAYVNGKKIIISSTTTNLSTAGLAIGSSKGKNTIYGSLSCFHNHSQGNLFSSTIKDNATDTRKITYTISDSSATGSEGVVISILWIGAGITIPTDVKIKVE